MKSIKHHFRGGPFEKLDQAMCVCVVCCVWVVSVREGGREGGECWVPPFLSSGGVVMMLFSPIDYRLKNELLLGEKK